MRGNPEPQITWYRNEHLVTGEHCVADCSIRGIFSLMIKGVKEEDGGLYTCQARNAGGIRQVTVELTVEGKNVSYLAQFPFWKLFFFSAMTCPIPIFFIFS